ncbi:MAG TPA: amidohydrolase, partial [Oceanospirillales bacterium]|nr:amidohydrolase [Oceanospirillales bacterium]
MKKIFLLLLAINTCAFAIKIPTSMINGIADERHEIHAFIHANIFIDSKTQQKDAVLLIKDNKVMNSGNNLQIPPQAIVHDVKGATIYPSFILLDSDYGLSEVPKRAGFTFFGREIMDSTLDGAVNSNEAIKASYNALEDFKHDHKLAKKLRKNGFGVVLSSKHDGIMRGTSVLVDLHDENEQQSILAQNAAFHLSFDKGSSKQLYPISLMGSSALIRQTWLDANWYNKAKPDFVDRDLQAVNNTEKLPQVFHVSNWQQSLLASKIALEHNKNIVIRTNGDSYKHLPTIKKLHKTLIVPLNFPQAIAINDELDAWNTSLEKMMAWQSAPYNLYFLQENKIPFAIAPQVNGQKDFLKNLRKAVKKGLSEEQALAALTTQPAKILKNPKIGNLRKDSIANFIIVEGNIFQKDASIAENWVAGHRYEINGLAKIATGIYQLSQNNRIIKLKINNKDGKISVKENNQTDDKQENKNKTTYKIKFNNNFATLTIKKGKNEQKLFGMINENGISNIVGKQPKWQLKKVAELTKQEQNKAEKNHSDNKDDTSNKDIIVKANLENP